MLSYPTGTEWLSSTEEKYEVYEKSIGQDQSTANLRAKEMDE
jgi:hypothetical protein